jgi:DUF971 family protein
MIARNIEIVKKNRVLAGETVRISVGEKHTSLRPLTPSAAMAHEPMQARVVESNSEYAIIEVICPCGQKTHIQCHYADAAKSG